MACIQHSLIVLVGIQDLQEEMERHKEMFLSLDQTGRQLVSGLTSQEDASLLRRSVHLLAPSQPTAQVSTIFGAN
jgi:hypothetical protein